MKPLSKKQWIFLIVYPFLHFMVGLVIFALFSSGESTLNWADHLLKYFWYLGFCLNCNTPFVYIHIFATCIAYHYDHYT